MILSTFSTRRDTGRTILGDFPTKKFKWMLLILNYMSAEVVNDPRRGAYVSSFPKFGETNTMAALNYDALLLHLVKLKNPNVPVTRTDVYVVLHTNSDGTCPTQEHSDQVESIKEIVASNPASTMLDLDHDPVAQVLGRDTKGRFRGLGAGVSRRGLDASAPAKNQLKMQKEMTSTLIGEVQDLKLLCGELQKDVAMMKSGQGSNVPFSPCSGSSQREHVANGRAIIGEEVGGEVIETYDVILDSVLVPHAQSTNRATLGEEEIGSIVDWPKALTVFDH
ncbi:hypothetical protein IFM89_007170 [Coptis chinensis]|uniref:Transposase n=1 Tax=Coptis chinensis TaxID=261450 RepID=A0A835HD79_9MAGN|nr:hypothetical protein IFM89_007170 [Coptis chinensis]